MQDERRNKGLFPVFMTLVMLGAPFFNHHFSTSLRQKKKKSRWWY